MHTRTHTVHTHTHTHTLSLSLSFFALIKKSISPATGLRFLKYAPVANWLDHFDDEMRERIQRNHSQHNRKSARLDPSNAFHMLQTMRNILHHPEQFLSLAKESLAVSSWRTCLPKVAGSGDLDIPASPRKYKTLDPCRVLKTFEKRFPNTIDLFMECCDTNSKEINAWVHDYLVGSFIKEKRLFMMCL